MKTKKDELASLIAAHCGDAFFVQMSDNYGTFQKRIYADDMATTLIDAGVEPVVHCYDCEYLGIKDFVYGYCKKNMCGMVGPRDYCSQGKIKKGKR